MELLPPTLLAKTNQMMDVNVKELDELNDAFLTACENGDVAQARLLFESGADKTSRNTLGESALHLAVNSSNNQMVEYLLKEVLINCNIRDTFGRTPLHWAAQQGQELICETLLLSGADIAAKDNMGLEAKIYAESSGHKALAKMFNLVRNSRR